MPFCSLKRFAAIPWVFATPPLVLVFTAALGLCVACSSLAKRWEALGGAGSRSFARWQRLLARAVLRARGRRLLALPFQGLEVPVAGGRAGVRPRVVLGCHGCQVKPAMHLRERVRRLPPSAEPPVQATAPAGFLKPDRFPPPEEPSLAQTNRRWRHSPTKETSASTPVERGPFRARHHAGPGMGRVYCAGIYVGRVTTSSVYCARMYELILPTATWSVSVATEQRKTPWTPMRKSRAWSPLSSMEQLQVLQPVRRNSSASARRPSSLCRTRHNSALRVFLRHPPSGRYLRIAGVLRAIPTFDPGEIRAIAQCCAEALESQAESGSRRQ